MSAHLPWTGVGPIALEAQESPCTNLADHGPKAQVFVCGRCVDSVHVGYVCRLMSHL